jgi:hypothetical protein
MSHPRSRIAQGVCSRAGPSCANPLGVRRACLDADTVRAERLSVAGQLSRVGTRCPGTR